jgi:helix-turn-helix protein
VKVNHVVKDKEVLKRLVKTQVEKFPDLDKMRAERDLKEIQERKEKSKLEQKEKEVLALQYKEEKMKWVNALDDFNDDDRMISNKDVDDEDDFM